jgi:hypothetical protein
VTSAQPGKRVQSGSTISGHRYVYGWGNIAPAGAAAIDSSERTWTAVSVTYPPAQLAPDRGSTQRSGHYRFLQIPVPITIMKIVRFA